MVYLKDGKYYEITDADAEQVLDNDEYLFFSSGRRIPYASGGELWVLFDRIQMKLRKAMDDGQINGVELGSVPSGVRIYITSDNIGNGAQGILNPADGKYYDSRSAYYRAVKDAGCVVMGSDAPRENNRKATSISKKALRSGLKQAADQLGF